MTVQMLRPRTSVREDALALARTVVPTLEQDARVVDADATFPENGLDVLRDTGLMGLIVPREYGGAGASLTVMSEVARVLAEACMSTSMIWGMHCQQVAALVDHGSDELRADVLPRIAAGEIYVASVTSERGKGGHLLTALAPLERDGDAIVLTRDAPIVTGGAQADAFLVTMRAHADAAPSDVELVWAERGELSVETKSGWDPMGMRGTHSVAMSLHGRLDAGHVVGENGFRDVAVSSFIPAGHIAWASSWLGAATGALRAMTQVFRDPKARREYDVQSDLFATKLARVRLDLAVASTYLKQTIKEYEALRRSHDGRAAIAKPSFQIQINDLKVVASEMCFRAVERLVELSGLRYGYMKPSPVPLERIFRDLRSASMMYANERLMIANGKLALLDRDVTLP